MSILPSRSIHVDKKSTIYIGHQCQLTISDAKLLAKKSIPVNLGKHAHGAMEKSYQFLTHGIEGRSAIYGINTQFGDQVNLVEPYLKNDGANREDYYESINARQLNLIRGHSCGLGPIVSSEIVKVTMMLRAHCLAQGFSGVRPQIISTLLKCLNAGITPIVRTYGSIGASGDLIPLAMIAAGITGQNVEVFYRGERMRAPRALELAEIEQLTPEARDGLALINGTSFMTAIASLSLYNLQRLFIQMLSAIAMSLESMLVIESAYRPKVHELKRHLGQMEVNDFLLQFWSGSHLLTNLEELRAANRSQTNDDVKRVQDFYSLRAVSQGFGPFCENIARGIQWLENEMNSVNDNPIIDASEGEIFHNANFMGYYVTTTCDLLKADIAQASSWIHALLANMVHPRKNYGLPTNLVYHPGKENGFRPIQLLAAALAVQNRKLAQVQQSYMLPTEGDNQDVNSLGTHSAIDFTEAVANLERLTAILILAACQALEFRGISSASQKAQHIHSVVRQYIAAVSSCRPMSEDINTMVHLLEEEMI